MKLVVLILSLVAVIIALSNLHLILAKKVQQQIPPVIFDRFNLTYNLQDDAYSLLQSNDSININGNRTY